MSKKISDVKEKLGIIGYGEDITAYILKLNGDRIYYFSVEPSNLSVLSDTNVRMKIENLSSLGKALDHIEYFALDDRENYSQNRRFLVSRRKQENNSQIRALLLKEEQFVKAIESDASSARRFLIGYHAHRNNLKEDRNQLRNLLSLDKTLSVRIDPLTIEDMQEIIAMYFRQDTTTPTGTFENFDGENYYKNVDFEELKDRLNKGQYSEPIIEFKIDNSSDRDNN